MEDPICFCSVPELEKELLDAVATDLHCPPFCDLEMASKMIYNMHHVHRRLVPPMTTTRAEVSRDSTLSMAAVWGMFRISNLGCRHGLPRGGDGGDGGGRGEGRT
jgi:hypothetical protein